VSTMFLIVGLPAAGKTRRGLGTNVILDFGME
jgi:hypothetical protein